MVKQQIKLWVDDVRDPVDHGYLNAVWVKTYEDAIKAFTEYDVIQASLDHDLGIMSTIGVEEHTEKTGYDIVCWMEENNVYPKYGCYVHSQNPIGAYKMRKVLDKLALAKIQK